MSPDEISKTIAENIQRDRERTGQVVFRGLLEDVKVNVLPENIFVQYFLPKFLGIDQERQQNWVLEWVSIAGTPMSEVAIIDQTTGQELFRVPPLLHTNGLVLEKKDGDIGDIFERYNQIKQNNPVGGLRFLVQALNGKNQQHLEKLNNDPVIARWMAILQRYGVDTSPNATQGQGQGTGTSDSLSDAFEF